MVKARLISRGFSLNLLWGVCWGCHAETPRPEGLNNLRLSQFQRLQGHKHDARKFRENFLACRQLPPCCVLIGKRERGNALELWCLSL